MEVIKVEGIVIKDMAYSETSKILTVLTKDYGLLSVISKGCRSMKSKLRGVSGKLTYGLFYITYKKTGLSTLTAVDVLNPLSHIRFDIEKISYASYLLELAEQMVKSTGEEAVFDLLIATLLKMEEGLDCGLLSNILELQYLKFLGVAPVVSGCVICGSTKNIQTVSIDAGGYLCAACYQNEKLYSDKFIKLLRMFYLVDISKLSKLDVKDDVRRELNQFIEAYYDQYTGLYLKSKKFLKNLKKIG